ERKTIYDDISTLIKSGLPLEIKKVGHSNSYFLAERTFYDEELYILADAVASSRFLTKKKSNALIKKLQTLTSEYKAKELRRSFYVENRTKSYNESIYYNINIIQNGIFDNRDITFKYYEYSVNKKKHLKHNGELYVVSPYQLIWEDDKYYLSAYSYKYERICRYRVDKMTNVDITDNECHKLTEEESDEMKNLQSIYSMYGGEKENVTIQFDNSLIDVVMDRFGEKIDCTPNSDSTFYITAETEIAPTFWGWLFQFGSRAKILGPQNVVDMAKQRLNDILETY
ncbi:MAG: helix-turn-helix transcriptional regulator, partial [Oscillospiraceae bacterium]